MKKSIFIVMSVCLFNILSFNTFAQIYEVIDLKTLGGNMGEGRSINDCGQITGTSLNSSGERRAFLYDGDSIKNLGTLGGTYSYAIQINNKGQITGGSVDSSEKKCAFLYEDGKMNNLGTLDSRGTGTTGINKNGMVTGTLAEMPGGGPPYRTGVIFYEGSIQPLNYPNHYNYTNGINDNDVILGLYDFEGNFGSGNTYGRRTYLYRYLKEGGYIIDPNIGNYTGQYLISTGINNKDNVIGYLSPDYARENYQAFAYINHSLSELGMLEGAKRSYSRGINEKDQIVGFSQWSDSDKRAFIWDSKNGMVDLNTLIGPNTGWLLQTAWDINNHGEITGSGNINGKNHAYLLKPFPNIRMDIKPQSCPNQLNTKMNGTITVAVLGNENFDTSTIDTSTVKLMGIPPLRSRLKDLTTKSNHQSCCECVTNGPDGFADLTMKFDAQSIISAIGPFKHDEKKMLMLTGHLNDGTPIKTVDYMIIKKIDKDTAIEILNQTIERIGTMSDSDINTIQNRDKLTDKINKTIDMIKNDQYSDALKKLKNKVIKRSNGCNQTNSPDVNDWVINCAAQEDIYPLFIETKKILKKLP